MKNTLENGQIRVIIFQEGNIWYGVALEFNIVESGDDPREVMLMLDEAIRGYVEATKKEKLSISVLNQETNSEYEKLWENAQAKKADTPSNVYISGLFPFSSLAAV